MGQVAGPADIVIVFDGRCRAMRRVIEDALTKGGVSPEELWVAYKAPPKGEVGKGNEVFMGADSHELAYVRLPQRRQRMKAKPRKDFCLDGASTTHCKTFANVGLPVKARLPRISRAAKPLAFGAGQGTVAPCPSKWDSSGVPLLWRESKTEAFWKAVLDMLDVTDIVDFSGGTGALACAAMSRGNHYARFVLETTHLTWLQNTTDTAALRYIAKQGPLYIAGVAELIQEHYKDLMSELNARGDDPGPDDGGRTSTPMWRSGGMSRQQ